jgi:RNA polymerase sigma-70 factor (ECF subfamily)
VGANLEVTAGSGDGDGFSGLFQFRQVALHRALSPNFSHLRSFGLAAVRLADQFLTLTNAAGPGEIPHHWKQFVVESEAHLPHRFKVNVRKQEPEGITQLLVEWGKGNQQALERLMPLVYAELRRSARNYLRHERAGHTLEPTALVNELYLRLIDQRHVQWQSRAQFFGIAAQSMRRILVDHARQRKAAKRGGSDQQRVSITNAGRFTKQPEIDLLDLHEALEELTEMDAQQGRIVELRFFGGLSIDETAEVLGIGHATVERDWKAARAWLRRKLE